MTESRIVSNDDIMGGVPCIAGTRIPVSAIKNFYADGYIIEAIKREYPGLTAEDIDAALAYRRSATDMPPGQLEAIEARHQKRMDEQRDWNIPITPRDMDIAALIAEINRLDKIMADISGELDSRKQQLEGL